MVMLVWFVLSLFSVCEFTWLPVFIDALLTCFITIGFDHESKGNLLFDNAAFGFAGFAFYKFFFDLTVSGWWILISPVAFPVMLLFPGGCTIINLLFEKWGFITLPTWGFIVGIVLDVIFLIVVIVMIIDRIKNKKEDSYY